MIRTAAAQTQPAPETAEQVVEGLRAQTEPILNYLRETAGDLAQAYFSIDGAIALAVVAGTGLLARLLSGPARTLLERAWPTHASTGEQRGLIVVSRLVFPILWLLGLWLAGAALDALGVRNELPRLIASLLNAWVLIRLFSSVVRDPVWSKTFAALAWTIAALNILHLLNPTIALLDSVGISLGETQLTLYMVIKGGIIAFILIWLAGVISGFIQARVQRSTSLTPSVQILIGQVARIGLLFAAVVLALNVIGVDLTALAVFSGAIGIGIGFGLQAIFSNLVAGIILLFEGSVKMGDFVDLADDLTGEVKEIGIRATRVTTNDNIDILVPNSEFINNRVTNWTLREGHRRLRVPFGVAYGTDKELVRKAALEAAANVPHELKGPAERKAEVWLTGFGDSSLDFELVVWLDPAAVKRPGRVKADYNWALETALANYGIEIPFPQRDLHIRSGKLPVRIEEPDAEG
ncbi:MAG: mechanosensitive ion channel [Alphaproteobacteria bacterium]